MKTLAIFILLLLNTAFAQTGGVKVVSTGAGFVTVFSPDSNAKKFTDAVKGGGTDLTQVQKFSVNYLVWRQKIDGIWTLVKAEYPFVGGTADAHKWNLKDPRDLDGAYRLSFLGGGWVHSSTGSKPNGTTSFANTYLSPNIFSDIAIGVYIGTNAVVGNQDYDIGTVQGAFGNSIGVGISTRRNTNQGLSIFGGFSTLNRVDFSTTDARGMNIGVNNGISSFYIKNSVKIGINTNTTEPNKPTHTFYLGGLHSDGGLLNPSSKEHRLTIIGEAVTETQAINMSNTVTFAQGILGRK